MKQYLLGIDIGTSACKTAVFDEDGHVLATGSGDYPVYYPQQGWAEQNPEEWWAAVCGAIKAMLEKSGIRAEDIAGIGIDGQSWSAIPVDKNGEVLANTPILQCKRPLVQGGIVFFQVQNFLRFHAGAKKAG